MSLCLLSYTVAYYRNGLSEMDLFVAENPTLEGLVSHSKLLKVRV